MPIPTKQEFIDDWHEEMSNDPWLAYGTAMQNPSKIYDEIYGNPYSSTEVIYECPSNCRDMSTHSFFLYSAMCIALGFCIGIVVGIIYV